MNQNTKIQAVSIKILGKDYKVACPLDECETLKLSAKELDQQMREIRDSGTVIGSDRIAVMAALNLTHELHIVQRKVTSPKAYIAHGISSKLANLRRKIENVLENH